MIENGESTSVAKPSTESDQAHLPERAAEGTPLFPCTVNQLFCHGQGCETLSKGPPFLPTAVNQSSELFKPPLVPTAADQTFKGIEHGLQLLVGVILGVGRPRISSSALGLKQGSSKKRIVPRRQAVSQGAPQMRPQMEPNGLGPRAMR